MDSWITLEQARWILSALVQAFAALTALAGIFAVFKLELVSKHRARAQQEFIDLWGDAVERLSHYADQLKAFAIAQKIPDLPWATPPSRANYPKALEPFLAKAETWGNASWARLRLAFSKLFEMEDILRQDYVACKLLTVRTTAINASVVAASMVDMLFIELMPAVWRTASLFLLTLLGLASLAATVLTVAEMLKERIPQLPTD